MNCPTNFEHFEPKQKRIFEHSRRVAHKLHGILLVVAFFWPSIPYIETPETPETASIIREIILYHFVGVNADMLTHNTITDDARFYALLGCDLREMSRYCKGVIPILWRLHIALRKQYQQSYTQGMSAHMLREYDKMGLFEQDRNIVNKLSQGRDNYTYNIQEQLADITDRYISTNFDGVILPPPHL